MSAGGLHVNLEKGKTNRLKEGKKKEKSTAKILPEVNRIKTKGV